MKQKQIIAVVGLVIVVGGLGFFGGSQYQKRKMPSFGNYYGTGRNGIQMRQGQGLAGGNRAGFKPVAGEIIGVDDKSVIVKMADGSSKIVLINDKTSIAKTNEATKTDLKIGEKISVFGTENSDGSVLAQSVQLNPEQRMRPEERATPTKGL